MITFLVGCTSKKEEEQNKKPQLVKVVQLNESNQYKTKIVTGVSAPNKEVNLSFRVSGPLSKFTLEEGQYIRKGDFIGQIDQRDFQLAVQKAEASFQMAKLEKKRAKKLFLSNNISKQHYDQAILNFETAKVNLNNAENALKDTRLVSPFSGYVKTTSVEQGEHVRASQRIITLQDFSKVRVLCNVPEEMVLNKEQIDHIQVVFDGMPKKTFQAKIIEISNDTENINYAYPMILEVDNHETSLLSGMTAELYFNLTTINFNTAILPTNAVMASPNGQRFVWGVHPDHQTLSPVQVKIEKLLNDNKMMVQIEEPADFIVSAGATFLSDGQKVRTIQDNSIITAN
ncbi:efflux RND transporter periplasmic adaptor subunit [Flammeovirga agarivorans]|uniref:Efflux RND transporter periplasmic adaptor subunit n=1 Tax=Flammeovirga agarivorans TaxID=2726742 RepID=A0A7X8XYC7_9BACT|nr:efflux RND transporter periplasmic adaptor subunit [Flammeovirga agarivorans]NLR94096.1 efflux RND transporter periplasmic adaptor subunit [Flammeovirga agarivorans]